MVKPSSEIPVTSIRIPKEMKAQIRREYPNLDFTKGFLKKLERCNYYKEQCEKLKQNVEGLQKTVELLRRSGSSNLSQEACRSLDYNRKGKPFCRNKKAPINTNDLTPKACSICSAYEPPKSTLHKANVTSTSSDEQHKTLKEEKIPERPKQLFQEKSDLIWCPYKEEWIHPVKCGQCVTLRFKVWQDCKERRTRDPNDPIFNPSKPKPLL